MKYHLLLTTLLFTTSQQKSDHVDLLLRFAQFQTVNWNWICGTHWYMRTISLSHILFVATLFVSRYLMTYKYNSYSTNWHFVFWLTFLCYILKLTHPDNRSNHPYLLTYKHTHTHTQLPNELWSVMKDSADRNLQNLHFLNAFCVMFFNHRG